MKVNPCKNCTSETGRKVGCHSTCGKYIEWKKGSEKRRIERNKRHDYSGYISDLTRKNRK
jgi:hypothetical protein